MFGKEGILDEPLSLNAIGCQIIAAITIICQQSFWIKKPLNESMMDSFNQFNSEGYVEKLKKYITPDYPYLMG
ncbi:hypothetical protein AX14_003428 [Amanita brunnescens Koide BX004]|nr:hypothetical protein AX14_003428 [Amanita brunnescens Koide BX004]